MIDRIRLRGLTTSNRLTGPSMKFFNFFMKFELDRSDRHSEFKRKTETLLSGIRSVEFEDYKVEQLRWVTDPGTQERLGRSTIEAAFFIYECKRRIGIFLSKLCKYANNSIDMRQIIEEGYKATIYTIPRIRPRTYGFDYNPSVSVSTIQPSSVAYLWGGESSGFHSYSSAFRSIGSGT